MADVMVGEFEVCRGRPYLGHMARRAVLCATGSQVSGSGVAVLALLTAGLCFEAWQAMHLAS